MFFRFFNLLKMGAREDSIVQDEFEETPVSLATNNIWRASELGLVHEVKYWLSQNPQDMFTADPRSCNYTPLHIAALNGHLELVQYLIQKRTLLYAKKFNLWKPLKWIFLDNANYLYNTQYKLEKEAEMFSRSEESENEENEIFETPLQSAAKEGHLKIIKYLLKQGADINCRCSPVYNPIQYASIRGHLHVVQFLLENGAEINATDSDLWTPLQIASKDGHEDIVEYLLRRGADVNFQNSEHRTALHYAACGGFLEIMENLIKFGADVNLLDTDLDSALHIAAYIGDLNCVKCLIKNGAIINIKNKLNNTPLKIATFYENFHIVDYLKSLETD